MKQYKTVPAHVTVEAIATSSVSHSDALRSGKNVQIYTAILQ
jgi:hypothetical protein